MVHGTHLDDCGFCCHAGNLHRLHSSHIFFVDIYRLGSNLHLAVQHQQSEVGIGDSADQLRTYRLLRVLALQVSGFLPAARIQ